VLIVAVDSHRQSTVYNRYATLIFTNPVFLGFSRYQNVKFGSQRDNSKHDFCPMDIGKIQYLWDFLFLRSIKL